MKLKKVYSPLASALIDNKLDTPKEIQNLSFNTIKSGADILISAPQGTGKTTTLVMSIIQILKEAQEEIPRAIIVSDSRESIEELEQLFNTLGRKTNLRVVCAYDQHKIYNQKDLIFEGSDIIIGTPKRLLELYNASGINLKLLKIFAIDNADLVLKLEIQPKLHVLASNMPKCQQIIFTNELTHKVDKYADSRLITPSFVEIEETEEDEEATTSEE